MKNKENALSDFAEMIKSSWTFQRMTEEEQARCFDALHGHEKLRGNYRQRWDWLHDIYNAYLLGLGYDDFNWRDKPEDDKLTLH